MTFILKDCFSKYAVRKCCKTDTELYRRARLIPLSVSKMDSAQAWRI